MFLGTELVFAASTLSSLSKAKRSPLGRAEGTAESLATISVKAVDKSHGNLYLGI